MRCFVDFISFLLYFYYSIIKGGINIDELIEENKELIYSIIYHFKNYDIEDLYQVGCIGVIKAYNNYNPNIGTKFTTYAYNYIVGEIYKYINQNNAFKLNYRNIKLKSQIKKAYDYLVQKFNREPTDIELSNFLEIDLVELEDIRNYSNVESLDYNYENNTLYDVVNVEKMDKETLIDLKNALSSLNDYERKIIYKRYFYNESQENIAKMFSMNQVKVSREEKKILSKIKVLMD